MMKKIICLAVAVVVIGSVSLFAQENLQFKGFVAPVLRTGISSPFSFLDTVQDFFRMDIVSNLSENSAASITPCLDMVILGNTISYEFDFIEAYVDMYSEKCDLRIGKQIVTWGSCKENNAVDVLNPSDFRDPSRDKADRKIGVIAIKSSIYLTDSLTLEAVLVPFAERMVFPLETSNWGQTGSNLFDNATPLEYKLANSELGIRLTQTILGANLSLTGYIGNEDIPTASAIQFATYQAALAMDPANATLESEFRRTAMIGVDFDGGIGNVALNTELAYFLTQDINNLDPMLKNPYLQWIVGMEYDFPLGISGGLQFSHEFQSGTGDLDTVVSGLGMDLGFFTSTALGCGLDKKFGDGDSHSFNVFAFCSLVEDGYLLIHTLKFAQSDAVNIYTGFSLYGGAAGSRLGNYSANNNVFLKAKYSF